jgi:hypothetical protein
VKPRLDRLERLARILDTADAEHRAKGEPTYCQEQLRHPCGTPACAAAHYAKHTRRVMSVLFKWESEFQISPDEAVQLFASDGCGRAKTAKQAAKYIRKFIARKRKELDR